MVDRTTWENLERLFSEYEAQQRLHELTGALHAAKLLPPHAAFGGAADGTQFVRLGAFAAKLVELDCAYQLADARRLLEQSRPLANATADAKPAGDFERRMLSYWNTAAGRVWYRLRDYPRALEFFKRSEEFASGDVGWALSCRSDYIRCEMEIARAFGKEDDAKKEARSELAKALKIGLDLRDENPVGMAEALTNRLTGG